MLSHPENGLRIAAVPATALDDVEERPGVLAVLIRHKNSDSCIANWVAANPLLPHDTEKERAGGVHDSDVRNSPVVVVGRKGFDYSEEKRMLGNGSHSIVRDTGGDSATKPGWVSQKRIESAIAAIVEIDVDSTIVSENEVANRVGTLNWEWVRVEGVKEPWVFGSNECSREIIRPELSFVSTVEFQGAIL